MTALAVTDYTYEGPQLDYAFKRPFAAGEQQWSSSLPPIPPPATCGWQGIATAVLASAAMLVSFSSFQPQGFVRSTLPDGWRSAQWDYRFAKPFPASEQQFYAGVAQRVPTARDVQGFFGQQFDYLFFKPQFPVFEQQYYAGIPRRIPLTVDVQGWFGLQFEHRFAKPFPITEQLFTSAPEPEPFPPPNGWYGFEYSYRFGKPFPVASQQWTGYQPQGEVPEFKPPGAGRRKDFPPWIPQPAYEAKPNKPFRPVWDKPRQGEIEQHPEPQPAAPAGPAPPPPASLFAAAPPSPALALPDFKELAPPVPPAFDKHMRDLQDLSDAIAVLKRLGLIQDS